MQMRFRAVSLLLAALAVSFAAQAATPKSSAVGEAMRWQSTAARTSIARDDWGIAHVHGRSDADAVFGMIYAQAEDDFLRIETNYLNAMGRLAEAEGEAAIFQDLRMKLFIRTADLKADYAKSPDSMKALMVAWADGLNCFLHSHPDVHPRVIRHFEPWMALSFSEGSIGGDIERVALDKLQAFYGVPRVAAAEDTRTYPREPGGSNGIAIAPDHTVNHHALLLINPHTTFFFRSELQVTSEEGLNVYGAATWGQFFIYQGFNERVGWMHTSSGVDNVDYFRETIVRRNDRLYYRYGKALRPISMATVAVPYRTGDGTLAVRSFTTYRTHHGPIIRQDGDKWVAIALLQNPSAALTQSYRLTKAHNYAAFMKVMQLRANSSNNTIYADADGNIAYLHPQFVPRRDDRFDYTHPVDGSDPATDWAGLHTLEELPHVLNPATGWVMNTNNWPYSSAGANSPRREDYPRYMDTAGENYRGIHARGVLGDRRDFTQDSLNAAAFDPYLPAFARLLPSLLQAYDGLDASSPHRQGLAEEIALLRAWDYRSSATSVATTLAVLWGDDLWVRAKQDADEEGVSIYDHIADHSSTDQKLAALAAVQARLRNDFGSSQVPWGDFNRVQRLSGEIVQKFRDDAPSTAIPFTSSRWGSLASSGARRYEGTNKYYGTSGNSFVAIVEFGERISARAVSIGGESGDPSSTHFGDQTARYAGGALRPVYFYPADLVGHIEREYRPR